MSKRTMTLVTEDGWILGRHLNAEQAAELIATNRGIPIEMNVFRCPAGIILGILDEEFDAKMQEFEEEDDTRFSVRHLDKAPDKYPDQKGFATENLTEEQVYQLLESLNAKPYAIEVDNANQKIRSVHIIKKGYLVVSTME